MAPVVITPLQRRHRPLLKGFRNQKHPLAEYLQRYALRHVERDLLSRTYLAIDVTADGERVAGYFSLTTVSVEHASTSRIAAIRRLPRFPVPGVLLARLAVDERAQGHGLGRYLFEEALRLTLELATESPVAFRLFVTDAIDEDAVSFYERFGLERLSDAIPARMALDLAPLVQAIRQ